VELKPQHYDDIEHNGIEHNGIEHNGIEHDANLLCECSLRLIMARECVISKYISYSALYPGQQSWFKSDDSLLCGAASWTNQVGYIIQHGIALACGATSQTNQVGFIPRLP